MTSRKHVPSFDLESALASVPLPTSAEPVAAGFFHRTLARWLGLPEGRIPGRSPNKKGDADVLWSYSFWKAELSQLGSEGTRQTWEARVFQQASERDEDAATYRYWIELDKHARIKKSGWLSTPPDLLADTNAFPPPAPVSAGAVAKLFDET